ncbi:pyridoxal 5'-phosphate synthase glutaminase subunit PdxT [Lampropedia aestuarii]|uniref:Pyridoxal 5'-phosphate synthase glutaminase subunit PdxT n=1 Tax=Lampropedia aestuarii TaxID=2562762 RepID=A0A4V3YX36_9BURK|nr:pyridoxal 5'-phosphate synthase glutaminase subunit PdxT [Lampropedia aestuarii]THJ33712.1 pyridoxal 5'-phosphate synthase glutaminase subunit PdxT [Lampropedia aestuarii]
MRVPTGKKAPTIGILALQGAYEAHARMLSQLGADCLWVRTAADLQGIDGLVLPGGESSTMLHHLQQTPQLYAALQEFVTTKPCLGTCAGLILLAQAVLPQQPSLGALAVTVQRNAYGRQRDSHITSAQTNLAGGPLEAVFIRAPRITALSPEVQVLADCDGTPVLVQQGQVMGCSFHPELGADSRVHAYWLNGF